MRYPYLLWDFDGTLFDTYPALNQAIRNALADFNITEPEDVIAKLLSDTLDSCFYTLIERHKLDESAFDKQIDYHHAKVTVRDRPPFPGALRVCQKLIAAGGKNYLFTHRPRTSLYEFLNEFEMADLFADCLCVSDGYPRKPEPAGFIALIEKNSLPHDQVLTVGDRDLDIQAGQGAGIATCLYNAQPSPGVEPDYIITTFDELEAILGL
jgi:phosphoglycolate phosphatase-like HAD superfamily hydrolase